MKITASPNPNLSDVLRLWRAMPSATVKTSPRLAWVADGRTALKTALSFLGGTNKPGVWLVPAYCCPALTQTFSVSGVAFDYYAVDDSLTPCWNELRQRLEQGSVAGVVFIHYFGFRTDWSLLKPLLKNKAIPIIEDCAHLPIPDQPERENMESDARIYSLRKWFPIPHGGALLLKHPPQPAQSLFHAEYPPLFPYLLRTCAFALERKVGFELRGRLLAHPAFERRAEEKDANNHHYDLSMNPRVINYLNDGAPKVDDIRLRQRSHYETLVKKFEQLPSIKLWRSVLTENECPFTFPLLIENNTRERVFRHCLRQGVMARVYWRTLPQRIMTMEAFVESKRLSEKILCLPIHYGLSVTDLDRIHSTVVSALRD